MWLLHRPHRWGLRVLLPMVCLFAPCGGHPSPADVPTGICRRLSKRPPQRLCLRAAASEGWRFCCAMISGLARGSVAGCAVICLGIAFSLPRLSSALPTPRGDTVRSLDVVVGFGKHVAHVLRFRALPSPVRSCRVLSCPVLSCQTLSCSSVSVSVLSCPGMSCLVVSCPVLSSERQLGIQTQRLYRDRCLAEN